MRQKFIKTFQIVSLLFLALPYFSALPVFGESVFTPLRFSQHQEFTPETEERDTSESDSDVSSTESDSTSTEGSAQSQEEAIDTPVEEAGDTKEQIEFLPPALPTPFPEPFQGIAPKDLTLNNSKINVIDEDSSSTWVPAKFYHDVDISKATLDAQWDPAGTLGGTPKTSGLKFYISQPKPELSDKLSGPSEYRDHPMDSNLLYKNVLIDSVPMDIKINVTNIKTELFTSDTNATYLSDWSVKLQKYQGINGFHFGLPSPFVSSDYNLTFYKSGTTEPVFMDHQFMYGDQEGYTANANSDVNPSDPYPYPESFDPKNVPAYKVGEQMTIEDAFDPAQPDKFSKFDLFSPNAKIEQGEAYISGDPDFEGNANINFGTFVYNSNALPKNAVIHKYFFYQKPTDTDEKYTGRNVDEYQPLEAQWSFRYSGTNTGTMKTQSARAGTLRRYVTTPPEPYTSNGWANAIAFASISPSLVEEPKKYVSDLDEKLVESDTLDSLYEGFEYTLEAGFPFTYYDKYFLKDWTIEDTIPDGVTLEDVKSIKATAYNKLSDDEEFKDLTDKFNYNLSGSKLTITAKKETLEDLEMYQNIRNFRFHLPVRITDEKKVERDAEGKIKIPNNFKFSGTYFNDETFNLDSNTVYTTAPQDNELKVEKKVDKALAETGKVDDADTSGGKNLQPITYSVDMTNTGTTETLDKVRVLDVLPNVDDGRNSLFNPLGSYTLTGLKFVDEAGTPVPNATIYYRDPKNSFLDSTLDPNSLPSDPTSLGWTKYTGDVSKLENSTAVLVYSENIPAGKTYSLKTTVEHTGNIGAVLKNTATANSVISDKLVSNQVETKIYGRELSGEVWSDTDANGLKEGAEKGVEGVPVKLYRTSLEDPNFKDQLVTTSVSGKDYIDANGKSLVKTDADGKYTFKDLPEGEYVAEFEFDDRLYKVTKKLVSSPSKDDSNSKVEEGEKQIVSLPDAGSVWNKTGAKLSDLPLLTDKTSGLQELSHNNMGIIPSAHVDIFKHSSGDDKGLEGADFEIFQGKLDSYPDAGNEDSRFVTGGTTDSTGKLLLEEKLFAVSDYTVFEVKAPEGYELYKKAIYITVNKGDESISLDVSDDSATVLPFTGGNKTGRLIVLGALVLVILGLGAVGSLYLMKVKKAK